MHVMVAGQKCLPEGSKYTRLIAAEIVGKNQIQGRTSFGFLIIVPTWAVPATTVNDLVCSQPKQKEVSFASLFCHFDGRPVARADGQSSVHHELHVACAAGLVAGRGDLIGDVACRNEALGQGNTVLGKKQNLKTTTEGRIPVNGSCKIVDELDD